MSSAEATRLSETHDYTCDHQAHFQMPAYRRSAAGRQHLQTVRSPSELQSAVLHLIECVLRLSSLSLRYRYDYITDRLRQIRQEMTIQNLNDFALIEPQIRFHAIARDLLASDDKFDIVLNDEMLADCVSRDSNSEYEYLWRISQGELIVRKQYASLISAIVDCNFIQIFNFVSKLPYVQACLMLPLINRCRRQYLERIKRAYRKPSHDLFCKLLRCRQEQIDDDLVRIWDCSRDPIAKCEFDSDDGVSLSNFILPTVKNNDH